MPARELPYPVFDADNHFYEPKEALTKFLPDHRKNVIDYIEVRGRTQDHGAKRSQRLHPQPDVRGGRPPRRPGGVLPGTAAAARATARSWASP